MTMYDKSQQTDLFPMELELMSSLEASPAKTSPLQGIKQVLKASVADSGQSAPVYLGRFDPGTPSLKTSQTCFLESGEIGLSPRAQEAKHAAPTDWEMNTDHAGTKDSLRVQVNKRAYWPTPTNNSAGEGKFIEQLVTKDGKKAAQNQRAYNPKTRIHTHITLNRAVQLWPTPSTRDYKGGYIGGRMRNGKVSRDTLDVAVQHTDNREKTNGTLNPTWVEWLMGFPIGHTDLNV